MAKFSRQGEAPPFPGGVDTALESVFQAHRDWADEQIILDCQEWMQRRLNRLLARQHLAVLRERAAVEAQNAAALAAERVAAKPKPRPPVPKLSAAERVEQVDLAALHLAKRFLEDWPTAAISRDLLVRFPGLSVEDIEIAAYVARGRVRAARAAQASEATQAGHS
jgi:hypothetical protein